MDARTIWAAFATWARGEIDPGILASYRQLPIVLHLYTSDEDGHHLIRNGKLYWMPTDSDGHWENTRDPMPAADEITHLVGEGPILAHGREQYWPSWQTFAEEVGLSQ